MKRYLKSQGGFTLVEVIVTLAIMGIVMVGLTSVIYTSVRVSDISSSRVEASGQIRNFQFVAYDDFARSQLQGGGACTPSTPCTTQPIVLVGTQVSNSTQPVPSQVQVTYAWDGSAFVNRQSSSASVHAATDVSAFSWYVDQSTGFPTVVVNLTVTIKGYSESQTLRYYPRPNP